MYRGITIDLGSGSLENAGLGPFGQAEQVDGPVDANLGSLHRVHLVVDRRGRAGQVVNFVHLYIKGKSDVVAEKLKIGILLKMGDVPLGAGKKVVYAQNIVPFLKKALTEERPQKSRTASD